MAIEAGRADGVAVDGETVVEAWEQLGEALRCIGEPAATARALTEARRLLREAPIAQARLCYRHAEIAKRSDALTAAVRWLKRGFRHLDALDGAEATAWRARMRSNLGRHSPPSRTLDGCGLGVRFRIDAYADFAEALIAEAEAFAGDAQRALTLARKGLEAGARHRPLLQRVAGIALVRLGRKDPAERELMSALDSARESNAEYDIAATIAVLDALGSAAPGLVGDRDEILSRLKIAHLPAPAL